VPDAVVGDPGRLRQILVNLVGNAVKFTERGEVVVRLGVDRQTEEEVCLHFQVIDTGVGIPSEHQALIFEPFTQADGSTTRKYGGTGLGLAISVQLVGMMGGRIWVESKLNEGSAFHFTVPARVAREGGERTTPADLSALRDLPVLVVDDNETNRRILVEMLKVWGMRPFGVEDAGGALSAFRRARKEGEAFRLALLDVHMPGMDGFCLAEAIRHEPELAGTAIILLTSGGQRGDRSRCQEVGVEGYLSKPVSGSELLASIQAVMGGRTAARVAAPVTRQSLPEAARRLKVLVAEDSQVNQLVARRLLEKLRHEVVMVEDGRQALAAVAREPFDVVLMDVQMPEMDGFAAAAAIRHLERERGGHVLIVALTAHAMKEDEERCLRAGMDAYLAKPFSAHELVTTLQRLLGEELRIPARVNTESRGS
jgi:CheY-like chemotaxis protein